MRENDLTRATREIQEIRRQQGFPVSEIPEDSSGWAAPAAKPGEEEPGQPPQSMSDQPMRTTQGAAASGETQDTGPTERVDPGPPRFVAIDLDRSLAGMAGGGAVELSPDEVRVMANLCLAALQRRLAEDFRKVAEHHGIQIVGETKTPAEPEPERNGTRPPKRRPR